MAVDGEIRHLPNAKSRSCAAGPLSRGLSKDSATSRCTTLALASRSTHGLFKRASTTSWCHSAYRVEHARPRVFTRPYEILTAGPCHEDDGTTRSNSCAAFAFASLAVATTKAGYQGSKGGSLAGNCPMLKVGQVLHGGVGRFRRNGRSFAGLASLGGRHSETVVVQIMRVRVFVGAVEGVVTFGCPTSRTTKSGQGFAHAVHVQATSARTSIGQTCSSSGRVVCLGRRC